MNISKGKSTNGGGGGILRSRKPNPNASQKSKGSNRTTGKVTFSTNSQPNNRDVGHDDDDDDDDDDDYDNRSASLGAGSDAAGGYDSDEVEDAIMASGDALSMGNIADPRRNKMDKGEDSIMDDAAVHSSLDIEEAKRQRGKVRRNETGADVSEFEDSGHNKKDDPSLSLITDSSADPDAYESNAGLNASCPVEPFNMEAEKESGLGYFDGDTYVFRQGKPVEGEEDAWLDGFDDENEETIRGGLDSTSVWKPRDQSSTQNNQKKKFKYVSDDAIPEDIGRRIATLLRENEETVMAALTRLGASIRQMQSQEKKISKRNKQKHKSRNRKQLEQSVEKEENNTTSTATSDETSSEDKAESKQLQIKMKQSRETVEELTELADALLFSGETDAYELTKADWIHRFKLEKYFPSPQHTASDNGGNTKRLFEGGDDQLVRKKHRGYFDDANPSTSETDTKEETKAIPQHVEVMWEYRGNEDKEIHGPYTSSQMLGWISCGYFVGDNAVDVRRVGSTNQTENVGVNLSGKAAADGTSSGAGPKATVDDLMADLMDDDDDDIPAKETETGGNSNDKSQGVDSEEAVMKEASAWMRSDAVDFSLYL